MNRKNIVAISSSVVDFLHDTKEIERIDQNSEGKITADKFLSNLPALLGNDILKNAPRAGDAIEITSEALTLAADRFIKNSGHINTKNEFNQTSPIKQILGSYDIAAGGSLANTVSSIAWSKHADTPLTNTRYLCVLDEGKAGEAFIESMPDNVVSGPTHGQCLRVHVIPFQDDRIMIASPSKEKATDHYDLSQHIAEEITPDTDMVMFEGFLAFGQHFDAIANETLTAIEEANIVRKQKALPPIHLVVTAASQPVSKMGRYQSFVRQAIQTTDVTVHANTGEFRRLLSNDQEWRDSYDTANNHPFAGLNGSELENTKRAAHGYREAKTEANIQTIEQVAIPLSNQSSYNTRFVVTDGGNPAYVVTNDRYSIHHPDPLDKSQIINKVGAGDAFMAGFWVAQLIGLNDADSMKAAGIFAKAAIGQHEARLSSETFYNAHGIKMNGPLALLPSAGLIKPTTSALHLKR